MNKKNILYFLIFLALVVSSINFIQRFNLESSNNKIELIMEETQIDLLMDENKNRNDILKKLKKQGLTAIAVNEQRLLAEFDQKKIEEIKNAGLMVIPVFIDIESNTEYKLDFLESMSPHLIMFSGKEITGDQGNGPLLIEKLARVLNDNNIKYGKIEYFLNYQEGSAQLSKLLDYNVLRVHGISDSDKQKYPVEMVIQRYVRAVTERNVRVLYLNPYLKGEEGEPLQKNLEYISSLKTKLEERGFTTGQASNYPYFRNSFLFLLIIASGIISAGILLLEQLTGWKNKRKIIFCFSYIMIIALFFSGQEIILRQILALSSVLIFPILAVVSQLLQEKKYIFLRIIGITFTGSFLSAAVLHHIVFLLNIEQFRGVKLSFLLPLIIIGIYMIYKYSQKKPIDLRNIRSIFRLKYILLSLSVLMIIFFYISRTGNEPFISVSLLERQFRDLLDRYLFVRPRFKDFLIGFPFLFLSIYFQEKLKFSFGFIIMVILGSIAPVNILNSFIHIHVPLSVSFIRTFNGLWLGLIFAFLYLFIIKYVQKLR